MPHRRLLYLNASRLVASLWSSGTLHEEARFAPDSEGIAAFAGYIARHRRGSNFYLMADIAEEGFLIDMLPYTRGADRHALLARKLGQYFFGSPLATAISYGREKTGRRDEKFLFTALTRPQFFEPWLAALRGAEAQLGGIYSPPLLGGALIAKISPSLARCLLITVTLGGIRQSYFENGQVRFSRLTSIAASDPREIAASCAAESVQIYQYLLGQRQLSRGVPLPVIVLAHPEQMGAFIEHCGKSMEDMQFDIRDLHAVCAACGLKTLPLDSCSETLFLHLVAQSPPRDQFAPQEEQRFFRLWQIRAGLLKTGAAALIGCLLYAGHQMADVFELRSAAATLQQQEGIDQRKYTEIQKTFPPMPASKENLRAVIGRFEELEKRSASPEPLYLAISRALGEIPRVELERLQWQLGSNPEEGLSYLTDKRGGAGAGATADKAGSPMYATAVIHGMLPASMLTDQRGQLETVNAFAQALQRDASLKVSVRRMPFDVESGKSLKSTTESEATASQPRFIIQVVRKL